MRGRNLLKFKNGSTFVIENIGIEVNGEEPIEIIDLSEATEKEFQQLQGKPDNKGIVQKIMNRVDKRGKDMV